MNYNTSRDECIMIEILLKKLDKETLEKSLIDIELHIDRQKSKIESDIRDLAHQIKDKQYDITCYEYLEKQVEKLRKEV